MDASDWVFVLFISLAFIFLGLLIILMLKDGNTPDDLEFVCADYGKGVWIYEGFAFDFMNESDYAKFCGNS